jgi:hypothetical protein
MAFPGTYNFSYYRGDTLEFRIYPKDSSGSAFDLTDYSGSELFTISTSRGEDGLLDQVSGYAEISGDGTYILCVITPDSGTQLAAGTQYVYDVEISKTAAPYNIVYTLLTGTITVTDQVGVTDFGES